MNTAVLDIHDLVEQLCQRAGVPYSSVTEIIIRPIEMTIEINKLLRDKHGLHHIDKSTGYAASRTVHRRVKT